MGRNVDRERVPNCETYIGSTGVGDFRNKMLMIRMTWKILWAQVHGDSQEEWSVRRQYPH